jgi:hypothetical protein
MNNCEGVGCLVVATDGAAPVFKMSLSVHEACIFKRTTGLMKQSRKRMASLWQSCLFVDTCKYLSSFEGPLIRRQLSKTEIPLYFFIASSLVYIPPTFSSFVAG